MHIVHMNKDKVVDEDYLAVLGVFMVPSEDNEVDQRVNDAVSLLTSQFKNAKNKGLFSKKTFAEKLI